MKMNTGKTEFEITKFPDRQELVDSWMASEKFPRYFTVHVRRVSKSGLGPEKLLEVRIDRLTDYRISEGTISFCGILARAKANSKSYIFDATCWPRSQPKCKFGELFVTPCGVA